VRQTFDRRGDDSTVELIRPADAARKSEMLSQQHARGDVE